MPRGTMLVTRVLPRERDAGMGQRAKLHRGSIPLTGFDRDCRELE